MSHSFDHRSFNDIRDLAKQYPLALILSGSPGEQQVTPLPVQMLCEADGSPQKLIGHFARKNPQVRTLAGHPRATAMLLGPQGYISPSWFRDRTRAPTWNYAYVLLDIEVALRDTRADADWLLESLIAQMEFARPGAWHRDEVGPRYEELVTGIVGFEAHIRGIRSCFKLGQDERDDVLADILRALDIEDERALSSWMRRFAADRSLEPPVTGPQPRKFDPQTMRYIDGVRDRARELTAGRDLDWPQRREVVEQSRAPWVQGGPIIARTEEFVAQTSAGDVRLRIYDPDPGQSKPTLIFLHGGGWAMFSINTHDRVMREFAARGRIALVGVDYALAPEFPYPMALNQVVGVAHWLVEHGASLGLDGDRLAIGGDSAGGNLSMAAALRLRDGGFPRALKAILSIYGGCTSELSPSARQRYGTDEDMLSAAEVELFWNTYVPRIGDRRNPYTATALADLRGLPPTFLVIAECDVLAEQNLMMAGCLLEAGVQVKAKVYKGVPHSFIEAVAVSRIAGKAIDDGVSFLRQVLDPVTAF